jgi:tRNA-specific 2-thiouridylase
MKVFVGLSGGVDSSVSAALLKEAGHEVIGVFLRVWQPDFLPCSWRDDRTDAKRVCATLGIPFLELDCSTEYKQDVADYMIREYKQGRTPNPDVMCNAKIKFGIFYEKARAMGADAVATGHYAQIITNTIYKNEDEDRKNYFLYKSADARRR